jgi:hypothetical protein
MKRRLAIAACFLSLVGVIFAEDLSSIYKRLYDSSPSIIQKAELMQYITDSGSAADAPYYAEILIKLNSTDTARFSLSEKDAHEKTVRLMCQKLGEYAYTESQDELIKLARGSGSAIMRADALIALGKVGGVKYIEIVAKMLNDLNMKSISDRIYGEQLAYGLIIALSKFKDIRGWKPAFAASTGWYSGRIKQLASAALPSIAEDPTEAVKDIIELEDPDSKRLALGYELDSKASDANKIAMCVLGLKKGVESRSTDMSIKAQPILLRKLAMENLIKLKDTGIEAVALCRIAYNTAEMDEKLLILSLYGTNKSDAAALAMASILNDHNTKRMTDVSSASIDQIMIATLVNAGLTKNEKLYDSVVTVSINNLWSPSVIQAAKKAMVAIKAK